jgi:hypothetical protein
MSTTRKKEKRSAQAQGPTPPATVAEPEGTEPEGTEPERTEPERTEPEETQPALSEPSQRRTWRIAALVALAPAAFAVGLLASHTTLVEPVDQPSAPSSSGGPVVEPTSGLTATVPSTASATAAPDTHYTPGGETGPGLTSAGVLVQVASDPSRGLEVVERVRFDVSPPVLVVAPPTTRGMSASAIPQKVAVTGLQLLADGNVVRGGPATLTKATSITLPPGTRTVAMRYRVEEAVTRSVPSAPGRTLVLLPPISSGADLRSLPVIVEIKGMGVGNLQCPGLAVADQMCGRVGDDRWYTVPVRLGTTAVLAELNLPDPVGT